MFKKAIIVSALCIAVSSPSLACGCGSEHSWTCRASDTVSTVIAWPFKVVFESLEKIFDDNGCQSNRKPRVYYKNISSCRCHPKYQAIYY